MTGDCLACSDRMRECRSVACSRVLESYGLDPTTKKCPLLFYPIERGVQLSDDCVGFISKDDQFDIELLVSQRNTSTSNPMPVRFHGSRGVPSQGLSIN